MDSLDLISSHIDESEEETEISPTFVNNRIEVTRRSINLMLESLQVPRRHMGISLENYHDRLKYEVKAWKAVYGDNISKISSEKPPVIGLETLSTFNRAYLDGAPPLQIFSNDSVKFRKTAKLFLKAEYAAKEERCDRLLAICALMGQLKKQELLNERETHDI